MTYAQEKYAKNKEAYRQASKRWRESHPDYKPLPYKDWPEERKKRHNETSAQWRKDNKERFYAWLKKYRQENPGMLKRIRQESHARKRSAQILFRQAHPELYHKTKTGMWAKNRIPPTPEQILEKKKKNQANWRKHMQDPIKWEKHKEHARNYWRRKAKAKRLAELEHQRTILLLSTPRQTNVS